MIHYALRCEAGGHGFDGWFRSMADFDRQADRGLVVCPVCGETSITKDLMRPAVAGVSRSHEMTLSAEQQGTEASPDPEAMSRLQAFARDVRAKADYVGPKFAEEARRIHFGETETRRIYGEASLDEVRSLADDGIPALPLPVLPEDKN